MGVHLGGVTERFFPGWFSSLRQRWELRLLLNFHTEHGANLISDGRLLSVSFVFAWLKLDQSQLLSDYPVLAATNYSDQSDDDDRASNNTSWFECACRAQLVMRSRQHIVIHALDPHRIAG